MLTVSIIKSNQRLLKQSFHLLEREIICLQAALHGLMVLIQIQPRSEHKAGNTGHSAAKEMNSQKATNAELWQTSEWRCPSAFPICIGESITPAR